MDEEFFNPQDQAEINEGISYMDADQMQEMQNTVNDKPSVTQMEDGRIVWERGGMNNPRIVHMLDEAAADPRTLNPERAQACVRDIAIAVTYDPANEGLTDAELAKKIKEECGANNLAPILFRNSENPDAEWAGMMDATTASILQNRPVKMKGLAEIALKDYRASQDLARQMTEHSRQNRRELEQAALATNESGQPVNAEGEVVEEGSEEQASDKQSDKYLDAVEYQKYKEEAIRTELLATMGDACSQYRMQHPQATEAELYDAARRAAAANYANIVNTVNAGGSPYAEFQTRRAEKRAKDNVLYFKRMADAKKDLSSAGELAQEVNAAVEAEKKATEAENRWLKARADENIKAEMEAKFPNATPSTAKKGGSARFKPATAYTVQVKRSLNAGNSGEDKDRPVLVVPQETFDQIVQDLAVQEGQYARVRIGSGKAAVDADIRAGEVGGFRMNHTLFRKVYYDAAGPRSKPTYDQLRSYAEGSKKQTLYFYVHGQKQKIQNQD